MIDIIIFDLSDDHRLNIHVRGNDMRGPSIDDSSIDDPGTDESLMRAICAGADIVPDDIVDIRHGIDYMSAGGVTSSRFVQLRHVAPHKTLSECLSTAARGFIPVVDAQDVLRASRSGGDACLELNMYHLMLECDIVPSGPLGRAILPGHHYIPMPETVSSLNGQLLKASSYDPVHDRGYRAGMVTAVPVIRDDRSGMVMIGLAIGEKASGQTLTLPSYPLPRDGRGEAVAASFVACKTGAKLGDLRVLGCSYTGTGHDGPVQVFPYVVTRPSAAMHQSCHFVTLRDAFFAGHFLRDTNLMLSVMRLTHALDLWPEFTQVRKPGYDPAVRL